MSYTIYNTDGSILLTLADGKIDKISTSLTLIGKNVNSYGEYLNNNLIRLLENFANTESPAGTPRIGQLWYDTSVGRLKIYDRDQQFRPVTNAVAADALPTTLGSTDFWFDTVNSQLYFSVDGQDINLIGPSASQIYGRQGWVLETLDSIPVTSLYSNGERIAILSTTTIASTTATGFDSILAGLNLNQSIPNIRFIGTATNADKVNGLDLTGLLRKDVNETTLGSLTIINQAGISVLNTNSNGINIYTDDLTNNSIILNETVNGDLDIEVTNVDEGIVSAIYLQGAHKRVGIWNSNPAYQLDVSGDTRIQGNLYVLGTATNIESVNLQVNDKQIELGYGQGSPSDTFANDGGVILYGATSKSLLWVNNGTGWNSSDNFNISNANNSYYINGAQVLSQNNLGLAVTGAPGLQTVGVLSFLTVTNVYISGNTIQPINTSTLNITATNSINFGNTIVTGLPTPVYPADAASKKYVDDSLYLVGTKAYGITLDVTNFSANFGTIDDGVKYYLDQLFPISNTGTDVLLNIPDGVRAKVLCGIVNVPTNTATVTVNFATDQVDKGGFIFSATVVSGLAGSVTSQLPPQNYIPVTTYSVQTWRVITSVWTKQP